eukprot:5767137-Karenia_brevis.AAC.1
MACGLGAPMRSPSSPAFSIMVGNSMPRGLWTLAAVLKSCVACSLATGHCCARRVVLELGLPSPRYPPTDCFEWNQA